MATADKEGNIHLWKLPELQRLSTHSISDTPLVRVTFSPDSRRIATASSSEVIVWDLATFDPLVRFPARAGEHITDCAFSADGDRIAIGSLLPDVGDLEGEDMARVYDARSGEELFIVEGHPGACNFVKFSPDGKWLLTGGYGAPHVPDAPSLRLWDAETGTQLFGTVDSINWTWTVSFSPDGQRMLAAGLSADLVLYDLVAHKEIYRTLSGEPRHAFFLPDGERFIVTRRAGFAIHGTRDGRELIAYPYGVAPAHFPDPLTLVLRENEQTMLRISADDWSLTTREARFNAELEAIRHRLELTE